MVTINPDDFLETEAGRVWTPERSADAWRQAFDALRLALSGDGGRARRLIVVCGLQGAGKSYWIKQQDLRLDAIYFDAALPGARHRRPIIDLAHAYGIPVDCVWVRVSLHVALMRNGMRSGDKIVPEASIRSVYKLFEAPLEAEGFSQVSIVDT